MHILPGRPTGKPDQMSPIRAAVPMTDAPNTTRPVRTVTVFGAAGPTGLIVCQRALEEGYLVRAVSRRDDPLPLSQTGRLTQFKADALTGAGVLDACQDTDAVISTLGAPYQRQRVEIYSQGARRIVEALREVGRTTRLVVASSGLTQEAPRLGPLTTTVVFPLLRHVLGRTLYADMRRMEAYLHAQTDISWTVMRPARLYDDPCPGPYRLDRERPTSAYTARASLAQAMVAVSRPGVSGDSVVCLTLPGQGFCERSGSARRRPG